MNGLNIAQQLEVHQRLLQPRDQLHASLCFTIYTVVSRSEPSFFPNTVKVKYTAGANGYFYGTKVRKRKTLASMRALVM